LDDRQNASELSLWRVRKGTENEHWGLHLHEPVKEDHTDKVMGSRIDACMNLDGHVTSPLRTVSSYYVGANAEDLTHFADIPEGTHMEAIEAMRDTKCTKPPAECNCVDWTKHAVNALHEKGFISPEGANQFHKVYNEEHEKIRKNTDWQWKESGEGSGSGSGSPKLVGESSGGGESSSQK
jgi:hypothetical protein